MENPIPRSPLINKYSDDIRDAVAPGANKPYIEKQSTGVTAAMVAGVMSGSQVPANTDLNLLKQPGIYRIDDSALNGPSIPKTTLPGFIQVITGTVNPTTGGLVLDKVRQLWFPDSITETSPFTRSCTGGNTWSDWVPFVGDGQRVQLTSNRTGDVRKIYYSFGNYVLTLPPAANRALGDRITLEQYAGQGSVKDGSYTTVTTPDYAVNADGSMSTTIVGARVYRFEVVELEDGTYGWVQDVLNNYDSALAELYQMVGRKEPGRRQVMLYGEVIPASFLRDARAVGDSIEFRAQSGNYQSTINLPDPIPGERFSIILGLAHKVTVKHGSDTEEFILTNTSQNNNSAPDGMTLTPYLEFEQIGSQWGLLCAGMW